MRRYLLLVAHGLGSGMILKRILPVGLLGLALVLVFVWSGGKSPRSAWIDRDCSDFSSQPEAQAFFEANQPGDPHRLDRDRDGIACETLSRIKLRRNPYTN